MPRTATSQADDLAERLSRAAIRPTRQRLRVLEELAREPDDATAQALHARMVGAGERVGLATVYRALSSFAQAGVIDALPHGSETCYRLCGEGHHHHLVCSRCHRVEEITDCHLESWLGRVASAKGFVPTGHELEVTGICGACRA